MNTHSNRIPPHYRHDLAEKWLENTEEIGFDLLGTLNWYLILPYDKGESSNKKGVPEAQEGHSYQRRLSRIPNGGWIIVMVELPEARKPGGVTGGGG